MQNYMECTFLPCWGDASDVLQYHGISWKFYGIQDIMDTMDIMNTMYIMDIGGGGSREAIPVASPHKFRVLLRKFRVLLRNGVS